MLKMWSKRHRDLARLRCQAACRLHATLCEIIPGGVSKRITTPAATAMLNSMIPGGAVAGARHELALAQLADLRRIDDQLRQARATITAAVRASGTSLTGIFGVGPVIAANTIYRQLLADARRPSNAQPAKGPGGQPGNDSVSSAASSHPERQLFGPATPRPAASLRPPERSSSAAAKIT